MRDVVVIEAAQHVQDSIRLPDLTRNLFPNPSPRALPQTTMSTDLDGHRGRYLLGAERSRPVRQALIGDVMTPTLGSMVQKGKLADCAFALEEAVEEGGLTDVGQAYDTTL